MKKFKSSRGWRNNNPLNIRRGEHWGGLSDNETDKKFCQFISRAFGYRAGYKILKSYFRVFQQSGVAMTIENIIRRWAPPGENDTEAYIRRVADLMDYEPNEFPFYPGLTRFQDERIGRLMGAMTCVECGCEPNDLDYQSIARGILLGGGYEVYPEDLEI